MSNRCAYSGADRLLIFRLVVILARVSTGAIGGVVTVRGAAEKQLLALSFQLLAHRGLAADLISRDGRAVCGVTEAKP